MDYQIGMREPIFELDKIFSIAQLSGEIPRDNCNVRMTRKTGCYVTYKRYGTIYRKDRVSDCRPLSKEGLTIISIKTTAWWYISREMQCLVSQTHL